MATRKLDLNAETLKTALWDTLQEVRAGTRNPAEADAIASQAREITRLTRTQLVILRQAEQGVSDELVGFAKPAAEPAKPTGRGRR